MGDHRKPLPNKKARAKARAFQFNVKSLEEFASHDDAGTTRCNADQAKQ